jgi:hypothetical protein
LSATVASLAAALTAFGFPAHGAGMDRLAVGQVKGTSAEASKKDNAYMQTGAILQKTDHIG